jgi:hypothetical protein
MLPGVSKVVVLAVLKLALRLELGPEYDSNANRAEVVHGATMPRDSPTGSFLVRTTARGQLAWRSGRNLLRASGLIGGKIFFSPDVQDQNMLVGQLSLEDRVRAHDKLELAVGGDYYDVGQQAVVTSCAVRSCDRHRDFRNGTAYARLFVLGEGGQLMLGGGFRGFQWKSDPAFDFMAGSADVISLVRFTAGPPDREHEIDLTASYHVERRFYQGMREVNNCPPHGSAWCWSDSATRFSSTSPTASASRSCVTSSRSSCRRACPGSSTSRSRASCSSTATSIQCCSIVRSTRRHSSASRTRTATR